MRKGNLVRTADGYYAIVVGDHLVFLGNGCEEVLDDEAWAKLEALPLNIFQTDSAVSNFLELIEGRAPCQVMEGPDVSIEADNFPRPAHRGLDAAIPRGRCPGR